MFSLGSLVVQVQSDQEKQLFAFENCKTLPQFEDQFPRLPVFTGCSKLPLPMRSFQSYLQTRWFAVFPSQLKQLKRRKRSRHEWAENPLSAHPLLSIETHWRSKYVLEGRHYPSQTCGNSCCQIASLACLSRSSFSWRPSSSIAMRDLACGELFLRTARSLFFSKRPQRAGRFLHFRWPFKTDRRTTPGWGEREAL